MSRTTVEVTVRTAAHRHPILGALALVFGILCLYYGGLVWTVAFGLLVSYGIWKQR